MATTEQEIKNGKTSAHDEAELKKAFVMGQFIYLRALEKKDVEGRWTQWSNDPEVTRYLRRGAFPNTYEQQLKFYEGLHQHGNEVVLAIVDKKTHKHIGVISIRSIDWLSRAGDIAVIIGEKDYWARFHAIEAMALMTEHGFERLNLHKIRATQHEKLDGWRTYLQAIGYHTEGVMKKDIYTEGAYYDIHLICIFQDEYFRLKKERGGRLTGDSISDLVKKYLRAQKAGK